MSGEIVLLEWHELLLAAFAGVMRNVQAMKNGQADYHGANDEQAKWEMDIAGTIGERVLCKYLGVYWLGKGTLGGADAGKGEQVRATMRAYRNVHLRLHRKDDNDARYWLVLPAYPAVAKDGVNFCVAGWVYGFEGKQEKYWGDKWRNNRPAFWVPASDLRAPALALGLH